MVLDTRAACGAVPSSSSGDVRWLTASTGGCDCGIELLAAVYGSELHGGAACGTELPG